MKTLRIIFPVLVLIMFAVLFQTELAYAQCPMCRAAAESNLKEGGSFALGLNTGILYLFCTPYIIIATLGFIWWRNQQKVKKAAISQSENERWN
ncbi:MAG: hypothetical protein IPM47_05510 [Sphingobacteriales bacterium]|nr:MAG: hypothetical protein IPM47_05510 [Sphingobacteriales bacterium]